MICRDSVDARHGSKGKGFALMEAHMRPRSLEAFAGHTKLV